MSASRPRSTIEIDAGAPVDVRFEYDVFREVYGLHVYFQINDMDGTVIFESLHNGDGDEHLPLVRPGPLRVDGDDPGRLPGRPDVRAADSRRHPQRPRRC